jgi:hypothetical protein
MKNILVLMADMFNMEQVPEIWETEEEKKLSIDELRRFYKEFALKNFRQKPYINRDTGWKIRISAQGIGEIRKFRKREHIILVRILDSMLENSILFDIVSDEKSTPGIENVSYFDHKCKINGKAYSVRLILKKTIGDDVRFFYYYKLSAS